MRHFIADALGNYIFFAPLVIVLTPPLHDVSAALAYLVAAVPISVVGARCYTAFLKRIWYPLWGVKF